MERPVDGIILLLLVLVIGCYKACCSNLALHQTTKGHKNDCSWAVDGIFTEQHMLIQRLGNQWWAVDLGQPRLVQRIRIYRNEGELTGISFGIRITDVSPDNTDAIMDLIDGDDGMCKESVDHVYVGATDIPCNNVIKGRYVVLHILNRYLELSEVEVFEHEQECKTTEKGKEYNGFVNVTASGRICQAWDSQSPHKHEHNTPESNRALIGAMNYCRNTFDKDGPWCYTTDPAKKWEPCDIPMCHTLVPIPMSTMPPEPTSVPSPALTTALTTSSLSTELTTTNAGTSQELTTPRSDTTLLTSTHSTEADPSTPAGAYESTITEHQDLATHGLTTVLHSSTTREEPTSSQGMPSTLPGEYTWTFSNHRELLTTPNTPEVAPTDLTTDSTGENGTDVPSTATPTALPQPGCPPPPSMPNSMVHVESHVIPYGGVVTVMCRVGYQFPDGSTLRSFVCGQGATWHLPIQDCHRVRCDKDWQSGDIQSTHCSHGRLLTGRIEGEAECTSRGKASHPSLTCSELHCPPLPLVSHTLVTKAMGSSAEYTCILGHRFPDGAKTKTVHCEDGARWLAATHLPCLPTTCEPVRVPEHGHVNSTSAVFGTYVEVRCDRGYWFPDYNSSSLVIVCQEDQLWNSTIAECLEIKCPTLPPVQHGRNDSTGQGYNDTAWLQCNPGYRTERGYTEIMMTCQADATWSISLDQYGCGEKRCPPVPALIHASPSTYLTDQGTELTYTCDQGYSSDHSDLVITCTPQLNWTTVDGSCKALYCPPLPSHNNSRLSSEDIMVGSLVTITCEKGYHRPGQQDTFDEVLACLPKQIWNSSTDDCQPVTCPLHKLDITHGYRVGSANTYGASVTYGCGLGYMFPGRKLQIVATCTEDATWSMEPPNCKEVYCLPLPTWDGSLSANSTSHGYGAVVNYTCLNSRNQTHFLSTCAEDGEWKPLIVECKAVSPTHHNSTATEGEMAAAYGSLVLILSSCPLLVIFLLDVLTRYRDVLFLVENLNHFWRALHNRP